MQPPKEPCERNALVLIHKCDICTCGLPTKWTERTAWPVTINQRLAACRDTSNLGALSFTQRHNFRPDGHCDA